MHDFLDNLGANQYEKMMERNATKEEITNTCEETYGKKACHEETYYNSESEGKESINYRGKEYSEGTKELLNNKEDYSEDFWQDYNKNTTKEKNNNN